MSEAQLASDEVCMDALLDIWEKELDAMADRFAEALVAIHADWSARETLLTQDHWAFNTAVRYGRAQAALEEMQRVWAAHRDGKLTLVKKRKDRSSVERFLQQARDRET